MSRTEPSYIIESQDLYFHFSVINISYPFGVGLCSSIKVISLLVPKLSTLMDSSLQEGDGGVTGIDTSPPSSPWNFVSGSSFTAAGFLSSHPVKGLSPISR